MDRTMGGGTSLMSRVFKTEIAVHCKGLVLAGFIKREGGLATLMRDCWTDVFERLLVAVYAEIARFDQVPIARRALSRCIRKFRERFLEREYAGFYPVIHRLGLTESYEPISYDSKDQADDDDEQTLRGYYLQQDERSQCYRPVPPLFYPLPSVLRLDAALENAPATFQVSPFIMKKQQMWKDCTLPRQRDLEIKGVELSDWSARFRTDDNVHYRSPWAQMENVSPFRCHVMLARCVVSSCCHGCYPATVVLSFLAFTDPHYSIDRVAIQDRCATARLRPVSVDVCRFLATALTALHCHLDLPLACLEKMKLLYSSQLERVSLGDQGRMVLVQLEIYVRYGFLRQARDVFWTWFGAFPSTSWIHQELVLIYCSGVMQSALDDMLEIRLTASIHKICELNYKVKTCRKTYVEPLLRKLNTKLMLIKSILLRTLSDMTLGENFRSDANNALIVCIMLLAIQKKEATQSCRMSCANALENLHMRLHWNQYSWNSPHLDAFFFLTPKDVDGLFEWSGVFNNILTDRIGGMQADTHLETPLKYAERLYAVTAASVFFVSHVQFTRYLEETRKMYVESTAGRHPRIAILERFLAFYDQEEQQDLDRMPSGRRIKAEQVHASFTDPHFLTAGGLVNRQAQDFAVATMRDCLRQFRGCHLQSNEGFCRYLRERDTTMPAILHAGLKVLRFSEGV
jgi:hypothetical protein